LCTIAKTDDDHFGGLGILIIIIDELPHEPIWRLWLEHGITEQSATKQNTSSSDAVSSAGCTKTPLSADYSSLPVRIWIHAKFPDRVRSPWVRERLVKSFQLKPTWGSLELTDVMLRMLEEVSKFTIGYLSLALLLKQLI
jgi:hypothetical protein